jgi:hypothetical protein
MLLLLRIVTGAFGVTAPSSSTMSACTVLVSVTFMVAVSVGTPAGSPLICRTISTGMQLFKVTAGDVVPPTPAETAVMPGACAVASPFASTTATTACEDDHVKSPTWLVISVPL